MVSQPCLGHVGSPARNDINAAAGLGIDQHGRVDQATAQREVVGFQHLRHRHTGQGDLEENPQRGVPGNHDAQCRKQPRRGPAPLITCHRADRGRQPRDTPLATLQDARDLLAEGLHLAAQSRAAHPAHPHPHHDAAAANGHVHRRPLVIAVHPGSLRAALVSAAMFERARSRVYLTNGTSLSQAAAVREVPLDASMFVKGRRAVSSSE